MTDIAYDMVRDLMRDALRDRPDLGDLYQHQASFRQAITLTGRTLEEVVRAILDEGMSVHQAASVIRATWRNILDREQRAVRTERHLLRHERFERLDITPETRAWANQQVEQLGITGWNRQLGEKPE